MKGFLLTLGLLATNALLAADVEVTVLGIDEVKGQVLIGFFDKEEDFQENPIPQSPLVKVMEAGPLVAVAKDLPPGIYSIAVIWDQNMNNVLDKKGFFAKPVEPYGFSNNPGTALGPPKYEETTFLVPEEGGKITIQLVD